MTTIRAQHRNWISGISLLATAAALALTQVLILSQPTTAQTYTVLYSFTGGADGGLPAAGVTLDTAGNLYGTTEQGGNFSHRGVVYKLDPAGNEIPLYSFNGFADGGAVTSGVVLDRSGNLYGTSTQNGVGNGLVYKVNKKGVETPLHQFQGGTDGSTPGTGNLIRDRHGNFYGTTFAGGTFNCGTVFQLAGNHQETVLYSFSCGNDGSGPIGAVTRDEAGNLYGTTVVGGSFGRGVVFKLDPNGNETVLHSFTGGADGEYPFAGVIRDKKGNLYGTANFGGSHNAGTIFKLTSKSKFKLLYTFNGTADGAGPQSELVRDAAGNLYGTTPNGGNPDGGGNGVVFELDISGHQRTLYAFTAGTDGGSPLGDLALDAAGNLYGTARVGGADPTGGCPLNRSAFGCGVVFKLTP